MKQPVDIVFPPVEPGKVPYWRLALRGCSQFCFQTNELTGLFFLAAVYVASPIAAAYLVVAAIIAPAGGFLLPDRDNAEETGLPGLNPSLIAVALATFYQTSWTNIEMWGVLIACVVFAVLLVKLFLWILPFPILILPFLIIFWLLAAAAPHTEILQPVVFPTDPATDFNIVVAVLSGLGQALFSPHILSGLLFLAGMLLSNWRHAVVALVGAVIGTLVAYYYRDVDPVSVNLGLYGFNGVLAAVSAFVICGSKLRLAVLGALLATILMPAVAELGLPTLSAPFLLTTWLMLALGWVEDKWFDAGEEQAFAVLRETGTESHASLSTISKPERRHIQLTPLLVSSDRAFVSSPGTAMSPKRSSSMRTIMSRALKCGSSAISAIELIGPQTIP